MKIKIINPYRKAFNGLIVIGLWIFTLLWLVIFGSIMFGKLESLFVAYLMLSSGIALSLVLLSLLGRLFTSQSILLDDSLDYELVINSAREPASIESPKEIDFYRNFLSSNRGSKTFELGRKQSFELLNRSMPNFNYRSEVHQTKFWEQSPKDVFKWMADILWAAS